MIISFGGYTDKGKVREINQDAILMRCKNDVGIFVVADGMGGHTYGEKASAIIVQHLEKWWRQFEQEKIMGDFLEITENIRICLERANFEIYNQYNSSNVCGSTVAILFVYKDRYCCFWCGDSRIYCLKKWSFFQVSTDDVWENQSSVIQKYTKEQRQRHPNYGKLLTAVGISSRLKLSMQTGYIENGQKFLLCSDGIYKMLSKKKIQSSLWLYKGDCNVLKNITRMKKSVLKKGAGDNFSVIYVMCS